jgi:Cupin domain
MVPEAPLEQTETGLVPKGDGWFVLNAKNARWYYTDGRPAHCDLEGDTDFPQLGINVVVLGPGEPMAMYHWETDQEDFLVVAGEAVLIVEGEERRLRTWDFVHCPPHEARDRRGMQRSVSGDRGRRSRARRTGRLTRLHRRRGGEAPWGERRGGHDRRQCRLRNGPTPRADRVPPRLAPRIESRGASGRAAPRQALG